ncbi:carbonic anhydrase [Virgisporangium aliadipatigenens]|uniref:carbonic anhydrase n=1 Tax=Virgisporangium aliadipatigenens TaxID=741659 RepID=A0A8J4DQC4_9ACTN|nr:carbonic anhydrase [Virgisporangium aliadipatigenens]GIJ45568.1 carbonic anhydrase [Virgisporangium aliadipatigenens]
MEPEPRPNTPVAALTELLAGNDRFVTGRRVHPHQDAHYRASLAAEQRPFAVVFGCSDSRLAAEMIFDRGLGDLFVVRTAGHILGAEVRASIEYGVSVLGAALVVVLGHDSCGAVKAAHDVLAGDTALAGELTPIVERVVPNVRFAHRQGVTDPDRVAEIHVRRTIETLLTGDSATTRAVAEGRCAVVGMSYRLAEGRVSVLGADPLAEDRLDAA